MKAKDKPLWEMELRLAIGSSFSCESYRVYTSAGYITLKIDIDSDPDNPREEFDNFSHMLFAHERYELGDPGLWKQIGISSDEFASWSGIEGFLRKELKIVHCLPVRMYDHSGITISLSTDSYPYNDRWDSGQIGLVYCTAEDIRENWGVKNIHKRHRQLALELIRGEIKTYDDYLTNDVYQMEILMEDGESLCSIGGYYGDEIDNGILEEAISIITRYINKEHHDKSQLRV
jgi:hypothetical protein